MQNLDLSNIPPELLAAIMGPQESPLVTVLREHAPDLHERAELGQYNLLDIRESRQFLRDVGVWNDQLQERYDSWLQLYTHAAQLEEEFKPVADEGLAFCERTADAVKAGTLSIEDRIELIERVHKALPMKLAYEDACSQVREAADSLLELITDCIITRDLRDNHPQYIH